ncbi:MAG TPA: trypsin-like peptidase domain-containing protein [Candidatus Saccharimonadales bacterium]|nr:trypsin-like peptidase domain-containing protein [Candidatus Saccharimonadales bacterium]
MVKDQLLRIFPIEGVGSGVIIDKKGFILTNNHVIEKANKLKVTTTDGNVYEGSVVGTDKQTDLAIIKIDSKDALSSAELGDSDQLKIGQIVIAIGNPFGLDGGPSVTAGIISSLTRRLQFEKGVMELIQTDAAINPGNSGGPLINTKGEVIGINTAKMPYAQGIGFAVPINVAKTIISDLIENGRVTNRPWLGISAIKINRELAYSYRLPSIEGSLIAEIQVNSPAHYADLRKGDIIQSIDGIKIIDPFQISNHIRKLSIRDKITVGINRYGKKIDKEIHLMPYPDRFN